MNVNILADVADKFLEEECFIFAGFELSNGSLHVEQCVELNPLFRGAVATSADFCAGLCQSLLLAEAVRFPGVGNSPVGVITPHVLMRMWLIPLWASNLNR